MPGHKYWIITGLEINLRWVRGKLKTKAVPVPVTVPEVWAALLVYLVVASKVNADLHQVNY